MKPFIIAATLFLLPALLHAQPSGYSSTNRPPQATSLLGDKLVPPPVSQPLLEKLEKHRLAWQSDPSADHLIWYGRFLAYCGDYREAIRLYTDGIRRFPNDARILRHRGHRYISIRMFDKAVEDFRQAARLISNTENETEPDGMPNARNIPVSTLHGNIYYHLGLACYLNDDMPEALKAYRQCLECGDNADNVVSATHWIYSILRRMNRDDEAKQALAKISRDMDIIENHSYHRLCLFYKRELGLEDLVGGLDETSAGDSIRYGLANWHFCNGDLDKATAAFEELVRGKGWASFGHIAAEADLARLRSR